MNAITPLKQTAGEVAESVIIKGDLSKLSPQERTSYYMRVCESVGLNPLTKPLEYITLNGKLVLYALRNCTDQLRTIHRVSVVDLIETERDGVFIVTAKVQNGEGRTDMAKGAVNIASLKGEALANALMKAETKAKRRATLSLCGLGFLDETEVEDIPSARRAPPSDDAPAAPVAIAPPKVEAPSDPETGEVGPHRIAVPELATKNGADWVKYGSLYIAGINASETLAEVDAWAEANDAALNNMEATAPKVYARLMAAVSKRRDAIAAVVAQPDVTMAG